MLATSTTDQSHEARLRRLAHRHELILVKSRCRTPEAFEYGRYMIVDPDTNGVVTGACPVAFWMDLDNVENYLTA